MPIRLLMYMIEIWREVLKGVSKEEIKKKDFISNLFTRPEG